jgi:hypothetical protein
MRATAYSRTNIKMITGLAFQKPLPIKAGGKTQKLCLPLLEERDRKDRG